MQRAAPPRFVESVELGLHGWYHEGHDLCKTFRTVDHRAATAFAERCARIVGDAEHEPRVQLAVSEGNVRVTISTPEHGKARHEDAELAHRIDRIPRPRLRPVGPGAPQT